MSLAYQVETLEGLDESTQALYKEVEGGYQLNIEGLPQPEDTSALKRAKDHEKKARQEAEKKLGEIEAREAQAREEAARKSGDIEALEKSWNEKHATALATKDDVIQSLESSLKGILVDNKAMELATKIAGDNAPVLLPHVKQRLAVDKRDGSHVTTVLDATGKPSALTIDELAEEFKANPVFASVIIGSKASGSGAKESRSGAPQDKKWSEMTADERNSLYKSDPAKYRELKDRG